jgi:hypothetical protein
MDLRIGLGRPMVQGQFPGHPFGAIKYGAEGVAWAKAEGNFNYTAALAVDLDAHHARGRGCAKRHPRDSDRRAGLFAIDCKYCSMRGATRRLVVRPSPAPPSCDETPQGGGLKITPLLQPLANRSGRTRPAVPWRRDKRRRTQIRSYTDGSLTKWLRSGGQLSFLEYQTAGRVRPLADPPRPARSGCRLRC